MNDERIPLEPGTVLHLHEIGSTSCFDLTIQEIVERGGSCIVYQAEHTDTEGNRFPVRIKECYPAYIKIQRTVNGLLAEEPAEFAKALEHFKEGYQKQMQWRRNPESMNSIINIQDIYEGYGTRYIAMSCQNAVRLEQTQLSVYDAFRVIRAVTMQIGIIHKNDHLYLDLKPQNVLLYPETPELVMLFDFDSAVPKDALRSHRLSYTQNWCAPELEKGRIKKISNATDLYSIGALLLFLLLRREPKGADRQISDWQEEFESDGCLLKTEKPEVRRMVTEIFRHTLTAYPGNHYQSCEELLAVIEPYIQEHQNPKPYLKNFLPMGSNYFCGRDRKMADIHERLSERNYLFLHGIGGIGKTELAKHYAETYAESYDAVVFIRFQNTLQDTICNDMVFPVVNLHCSDGESAEDYYARKCEILQKICTPRHLLILDNFDMEECDGLDELFGLPCKLLITSRIDFADVFPQMDVGILDSIEDIRAVMTYYWDGDADNFADQIIYAVEGHTMGVELTARQMQAADMTAEEMYEQLTAHGISATKEKIRHFKDGSLRSKSAVQHLEILFSVFGLPEKLLHILRYLAMIGTVSVPKDDFCSMCDLNTEERTNFSDTVQRGWVQMWEDSVQVHPLISELLMHQLHPDTEAVRPLLEYLLDSSKTPETISAEQRFSYEQIMQYAAEHLHGNPEILIPFLHTAQNIDVDFHQYDKAERCVLKRLDIAGYEADDWDYYDLAVYASEQGEWERAESYEQNITNAYIIDRHEYYLSFNSGDFEAAKGIAQYMLDTYEDGYLLCIAAELHAKAEEQLDSDPEVLRESWKRVLDYAMQALPVAEYENETKDLVSAAANAFSHMKNYDKAVDVFQKYADRFRSNVYEFTDWSKKLARIYAHAGEKALALQTFDTCISEISAHYVPQHPRYSDYIRRLAMVCDLCAIECCDDAGDFDADYLQKYLEMLDLLLPVESDPEQLADLEERYASQLNMLGRKAEVKEHLQKAIAHYQAVYEEDSEEWIRVYAYVWKQLYSTAPELNMLGRKAEVKEHLQKAIAHYQAVYEEDSEEWIRVYAYVWGQLYSTAPEWKLYYDRLMMLCQKYDCSEVANEEEALLKELMKAETSRLE